LVVDRYSHPLWRHHEAAVYARISSDIEGSGLGVKRQVEDCRRLAASLGWIVAEEYIDNDLSVYSGKAQPAYQRMLDDLRDGLRDAVIVYHVDRLTRRAVELEDFVTAVDTAKVRQVRFVVGDMDLGTGDGLMIARMLGAMAAHESATKSRRVRRKMEQNAVAGLPHGGWHRPFGYDEDKVTVRADEAAVIRTLVARFLAGESLRSLAVWLDSEGVRTVSGKEWRTPTLRAMLTSGRIAGLREHRGVVVGSGIWEPIISEHDHRRVLTRMAERKVTGRRTPQRYLLSGLLRCGKCGNVLYSSPRKTTRRNVCLSGPDHGGCGQLAVVADPLERLIADAVIYRLDTPALADALAGKAAKDEQGAAVAERLSADQAQLDELAQVYAAGDITMREWISARKPIQERVRDAERRLSRATRTDALHGLVGNGDALRTQWAGLNLDRQHAIVCAILDHAVIAPGTHGARALDRDRVQPVWRL
jgi:DNA invertase Pin-like site-specific DNA recombinase